MSDEDYYRLWGDVYRFDALLFVQNQVQPVLMSNEVYRWRGADTPRRRKPKRSQPQR